MKKALVICSFFIAALFIISSYQSEDSRPVAGQINKDFVKKPRSHKSPPSHQHAHSHHHKGNRHPTSVAESKIHNENKEKANIQFGHVKKELTESDIEVIEKVKSNIPALADSDFEIVKRLKITDKSIYIVNRTFNGMPQSFTALVDNKSGRIEKSWGKTRYEIPQATRHYPVSTY